LSEDPKWAPLRVAAVGAELKWKAERSAGCEDAGMLALLGMLNRAASFVPLKELAGSLTIVTPRCPASGPRRRVGQRERLDRAGAELRTALKTIRP